MKHSTIAPLALLFLLLLSAQAFAAEVNCKAPPYNKEVPSCELQDFDDCLGHCAKKDSGGYAPCAQDFYNQQCFLNTAQTCLEATCAPLCPVNDPQEHHIAGPAGGWGISALRVFRCRAECEREKGWVPLNYAIDRCDNIGEEGVCCGKYIYPFCGDGKITGNEQCETDAQCVIGNMGTIWEDYTNCIDCMCYKGRNFGGGGGSGSWTFGTTQCQGASCTFTTNPVPGGKSCLTDDDCEEGYHNECVEYQWGFGCDTIENVNTNVEEPNQCFVDSDCDIAFLQEFLFADATVGENTMGQNQGCPSEFYPTEITVDPVSNPTITLYSDRDGPDFDCRPSYDPAVCPDEEDATCPYQGTGCPDSDCCMQYHWECTSEECPNLSNFDPSYPKLSHDRNPSFAIGPGDEGKAFQFELVVKDYWGMRESMPSIVLVNVSGNEPPTAVLNADPSSGDAPLTVTFTGSCSDEDGTVESCVIDFGDGEGDGDGEGEEDFFDGITHQYAFSNICIAELTATDNLGATGTDSEVITVGSFEPPIIESFLKITRFSAEPSPVDPADKKFSSIVVEAKNLGLGPETAQLEIIVRDPVSNQPILAGPTADSGLLNPNQSHEFIFNDVDLSSLESGSYKLSAELYRVAAPNVLNDRKSIQFIILKESSSIPETMPLLAAIAALAVFAFLWKKR